MTSKSTGDPVIDRLYQGHKGKVEFVDVPELGYLMVEGQGAPMAADFTAAIQALYTVSYGAHFMVKKTQGDAPRMMSLEALWWVVGPQAQATMELIASGAAGIEQSDRDQWHWQAMIMQLPPIDSDVIDAAIAEARSKKPEVDLAGLGYLRWTEGPCAQILHVGPYATEAASIVTLHREIVEHGYRPRGRHHEIYLGDPRTSDPERLRTLLRQPVEPAGGPAPGSFS